MFSHPTVVALVERLKLFAVCMAVLAALVGLAIFGLDRMAAGMCASDLQKTIPSPDGTLKAVVYQFDCGATTDFSTQVSILKKKDELQNEGGNTFSCDDYHRTAKAGPGGLVRVSWTGPRQLLIQYAPKTRIFRQEKEASVRTGWFNRETVTVRCEPLAPK